MAVLPDAGCDAGAILPSLNNVIRARKRDIKWETWDILEKYQEYFIRRGEFSPIGAGLPIPPKRPYSIGAGLPTPPKPPTEGLQDIGSLCEFVPFGSESIDIKSIRREDRK